MKAFVLAGIIFSMVTFAETKILVGVVDLQRALQTVDAGKAAKDNLEKKVQAKKLEIEKKQKAFQAEAEQFEKKAAILNDAAKGQKQAELQKKFLGLQQEAQQTQMELQKEERELTGPILNELKSISEAIGKEKGFQLVVEKNEGGVLFAESGADQTDLVIEKFNAKNKGSKKK